MALTDSQRREVEILILESALERSKEHLVRLERRANQAQNEFLDAEIVVEKMENKLASLRHTYLSVVV